MIYNAAVIILEKYGRKKNSSKYLIFKDGYITLSLELIKISGNLLKSGRNSF